MSELKKENEKTRFEKDASRMGFKLSDYGKIFSLKGEKYELIGFNTKSSPVTCVARSIVDGTEVHTSKIDVACRLKRLILY